MSNQLPLTLDTIETVPFHLPMHGALQWGKSSSFASVSHVAVRLLLSDGSEGWAEAPPRPTIYGETIHSIPAAIRHELAPRLKGLPVWSEDAPSTGALWTMPELQRFQSRLHELKNNHTAKAAIDMALHSALTQHRGLSLLEHLLDGKARQADRLRVSYILGIGDRDTVLEEARRVVDQGVRVLKVKVGRTWDEDIARIRDLQAELGPTVDLYADANDCSSFGAKLSTKAARRYPQQSLAHHGWLFGRRGSAGCPTRSRCTRRQPSPSLLIPALS